MKQYEAIGVIETQYFTRAMAFLDDVLKVADVEFLTSENYLGGRLVTLIIGGSVSSVDVALDVVRQNAGKQGDNALKMALLITNPHEEIMKYVVPKKVNKKKVVAEKAPKKSNVTKTKAKTGKSK